MNAKLKVKERKLTDEAFRRKWLELSPNERREIMDRLKAITAQPPSQQTSIAATCILAAVPDMDMRAAVLGSLGICAMVIGAVIVVCAAIHWVAPKSDDKPVPEDDQQTIDGQSGREEDVD